MKRKVFIFDFWDTLMQYDYNGLKANQALLDVAISNPNKVDAKQLLDAVNKMFVDIRHESKKLEVKFKDVHKLVHDLLDLKFDKSYDELETIFISNAYTLTPHDHAYTLLKYLQENGYKIALLSNTILRKQTIEAILKKNFPDISFDPLIVSSEVVFKKPHPKIYELMLKKLDLIPELVYFVGDNIDYDVIGPTNAGMFAFFYNHRGAKINIESINYYEVKSHLDIINYLEEHHHENH
jgi:putative hydrolase of the HAD superfamily